MLCYNEERKFLLSSPSHCLVYWQDFWNSFSAAVHQQKVTPVAKFSSLKSVLKDAAAVTISGISVSNENYDMALLLLRERFGRLEKIIESLYSQLQLLPKLGNGFKVSK